MPGEDERRATRAAAPETAAEREAGSSPGQSSPPREGRSPLDLVPEILKRGLSAGRDVSESLFPRELASNLAAQLIDARHGLVTAIATEVGRFLRQADIASEVRKVLAGLNVEAKIQVRFSEDDSGKLQSKIELERERSGRRSSKPPPPESASKE